MKKSKLLLVLLFIAFISCNKKEESDCDYSELSGIEKIGGRGGLSGISKNGKLFTGICTKKDQYDSIVEKSFVKNGFLIQQISRIKVNNNYYTLKDIKYENEKQKDGYEITLSDASNIKYASLGEFYKNGVITGWNIDLFKDDSEYHIIVTFPHADEKSIKKLRPKSMADAKVHQRYIKTSIPTQYGFASIGIEDGFETEYNLSEKKCFEILDGLKKELPHFDYWKK